MIYKSRVPIDFVDCSLSLPLLTNPYQRFLRSAVPINFPSQLKNKLSLYYKMSGGIAQLVAVGAQDVHLVGQPEVSFFRSTYKRHTNFSQTVERQVIQGALSQGGMSTVRFERKGDLLGYTYFTSINNASNACEALDWSTMIDKVELLVGGQVIDDQDAFFTNNIAPNLFATGLAKYVAGELYDGSTASNFYPLRFSFCENWQSALPLVALQYHDVELRIRWKSHANVDSSVRRVECHANYIYLDTDERELLARDPRAILITQVQKSLASLGRTQELNFNHPVKFLAASNVAADSVNTAANRVKLQINGTDVTDFKFIDPHYTSATSYYHSPNAKADPSLYTFPFCLDTSKLQPTGSLNFSRLDSARIVSETTSFKDTIYAVNYNILRVENGMGGLMYSN